MGNGSDPGQVVGRVVDVLTSPGVRWFTAILALAFGWYLGALLVRVFGRRFARRFQRPSVTRTVLRGVRVAGVAVGVLLAAVTLGLGVPDIAISVTVFSAVLGLVLAPIVGSVVNGLFILADQPYEVGDMIELVDRGQRGFIEDITLRYTKVFTLDNTFMVIPNATIRERDIVNYSAEDERTRLSLDLVVTYEGDLDTARTLAERAAAEVESVVDGGPDIRIGSARYPAAPTCYIDTYGDHGVHLRLRYWARQPYKLLTVRSSVQENVWERLEATDDVEIAYPHSHLVFDETSGEARVAMRERAAPPGRGPAPRSDRDTATEGTDDAGEGDGIDDRDQAS